MRWRTFALGIGLALGLVSDPASAQFIIPGAPACTLAAGPLQLSIAGDLTRTCGAQSHGGTASVKDAIAPADCFDIPGAVGGGAEALYLQWDTSLGAGGEWKCVTSGDGGLPLTVRDEAGAVSDPQVSTIRVNDGALSINGAGDVSIDLSTGVFVPAVQPGDNHSQFDFDTDVRIALHDAIAAAHHAATIDTNAETECATTESLRGDGSCAIPLEAVVQEAISANALTGLLDGGEITINADPTKFDLAAGNGIIVDWTDPLNPVYNEVSWPQQLAISPTGLATELFTTLGINASGTLVQGPGAPFSPQRRRSELELTSIVHSNNVVIDSVTDDSVPAYEALQSVLDFIEVLGVLNRGNSYLANGANLQVDKIPGVSTLPFINRGIDPQNPTNKTDAAQIAISNLVFNWQDGAGGVVTLPGQSAIDPDRYDDGSGTRASMPANRWQIQRFFYFSQNGNTLVAYGQTVFLSKDAARSAIFTELFISNPQTDLGTLTTALLLKTGATDLSDDAVAEFVPLNIGTTSSGGFAPNPSPSADHANFDTEVSDIIEAQAPAVHHEDSALFRTTVAALPSVLLDTGKTYQVTDGQDAGDCTTGGGSIALVCIRNATDTGWLPAAGSVPNASPSADHSAFVAEVDALIVANVSSKDISGINPALFWEETDAALDSGTWSIEADATNLDFRAWNDARSASAFFMRVHRTGALVDDITFQAPILLENGLAAEPAIAFASASTTGFFISGGEWNYTVLGVDRGALTSLGATGGTPLQVPVFGAGGRLDGFANFTYDGTTMLVNRVLTADIPGANAHLLRANDSSPYVCSVTLDDITLFTDPSLAAKQLMVCNTNGEFVIQELDASGNFIVTDGFMQSDGLSNAPTHGRVKGKTLQALAAWQAISDGSFEMTIDGVSADITALNFSGISATSEVAGIVQTGLRAIGTGGFTLATVTHNGADPGSIEVFSGTTGASSIILAATTVAPPTGTDIAGNPGLRLQTADAQFWNGLIAGDMYDFNHTIGTIIGGAQTFRANFNDTGVRWDLGKIRPTLDCDGGSCGTWNVRLRVGIYDSGGSLDDRMVFEYTEPTTFETSGVADTRGLRLWDDAIEAGWLRPVTDASSDLNIWELPQLGGNTAGYAENSITHLAAEETVETVCDSLPDVAPTAASDRAWLSWSYPVTLTTLAAISGSNDIDIDIQVCDNDGATSCVSSMTALNVSTTEVTDTASTSVTAGRRVVINYANDTAPSWTNTRVCHTKELVE